MSIAEVNRPDALGPIGGAPVHDGSVTRRAKRRAALVYWGLALVGAIAFAVGPTWLGALGVGLWSPGAGFLLADGWAIALLPLTLVLFACALVAWFWAGMLIAPLGVWLGSAALAAFTVSAHRSWWGAAIAVASLAVFCTATALLGVKRRSAARERRAKRIEYLPQARLEVRQRAATAARARATDREMSDHQLAHLRTYLNIALQPYGDFSSYNIIDQFQPAAVRYQINQLGYTLAMSMAEFTPNFHGYSTQAQRNLVELYRHRRVWQYWRYENAWGNFNLNPDPAAKDNIMLTGFYGLHVALYTAVSGDRRYLQDGSLTFKLDDRRQYPHSLPKIIDNIMDNFRMQPYVLYPCEPNWVYTGCNFRGLTAVAAYDKATGSENFAEFHQTFRRNLNAEFMTADAGVVPLRSNLTGLSVPFPAPDSSLVLGLAAIYPDLAEQYWAFVRKEILEAGPAGINVAVERSVDFGNYKIADNPMLPYLLIAAQEMGDYEVGDRIMEVLDETKPAIEKCDGSVAYDFSVLTDASLLQGRLMQVGSWTKIVTQPLSEAARSGPVLDEVSYPDVLVAKAHSDGHDLRLVLAAGTPTAGRQRLGVKRLSPNARYDIEVEGRRVESITATADGTAEFDVVVAARTPVVLTPAGGR